jgi:hypothetical protein
MFMVQAKQEGGESGIIVIMGEVKFIHKCWSQYPPRHLNCEIPNI